MRTYTTPSLRFHSLSRHQSVESTCWGVRLPPTFRSQCSSHSQRFTPHQTFWTYFIPKPRLRFAFQGFSPHLASTARRCFVPSSYSLNPPINSKLLTPVLLAARSRCCSKLRSVTPIGGVSANAVRSPLRLFTSPGFSPMTLKRFWRSPLMSLACEVSQSPHSLNSSVSQSSAPCFCLQRHGPAQVFLPELTLRGAPKLDTRFSCQIGRAHV